MNDLEQHFKKATEQIRMTDSEKSAMRFSIEKEIGTPSPYVWMFAPRSLAVLGVALLVIFSTSSVYASEGSLPGSPLYPVKTKIVEPLKIALAPTVEAKAQANANIAATRVHEAQILAARGTLTSETVQQISDSYNVHASAALALAADVEAREGTHEEQDVDIAIDTDEPVEGPSDTSGEIVAISATAPVALSVRVEATSSEETHPAAMNAPRTEGASKNKSRNFVRTLRASLSAQAEILQQLDAQVRVGKERKEDN